MAQFDEDKIISPLHTEKAEVGKKYWVSDTLVDLKDEVEEEKTPYELKEVYKGCFYPFVIDGTKFQFLYPYEEPPKQRMTSRQLAEWLAKGNGELTANIYTHIYVYHEYHRSDENKEVNEDVRIRSWDSED